MTSPLHGEDPRFESGQAHSFLGFVLGFLFVWYLILIGNDLVFQLKKNRNYWLNELIERLNIVFWMYYLK